MKLTEKDKFFLTRLKELIDSREMSVELKIDKPSYMILRGTYGEKIHEIFRTSRQGVRWRFQRIFSDVYVSAFETIMTIEKTFGTYLREHAIRISKERYVLRQEMLQNNSFKNANTLTGQSQDDPENNSCDN